MINKIKFSFFIIAILTLNVTKSQTLPNMGTAANYGILAGTYFSAQDTVTVRGTAGCNSGSLDILKADAKLTTPNPAISIAISDLTNCQNFLFAQSGTALTNTITNQTLITGVYSINSNALFTGNLKLSGDTSSVFIFNVLGDLTFDNAFINSSKNTIFPSKIFWNVSGKVTIKGVNQIIGNILSQQKITVSGLKVGNASLLSQDSVLILNAGKNNDPLFKNPFIFYSKNLLNKNTSVTTGVNCLTQTTNCNIITNPSFEDMTIQWDNSVLCPDNRNEIDLACDWYKHWGPAAGGYCCQEPNFGYPLYGNNAVTPYISWGLTADFFALCGSGEYYSPNNFFTCYLNQNANTGTNYAGIKCALTRFDLPGSGPIENLTDNTLKKKLPNALTPGKVYYMEFFSNLANIANKSAKLSVYPLFEGGSGFDQPLFYNSPTPFFTSATTIPDDSNWHKVSGCFSTTYSNVEYVGIKTYVNSLLPAAGIVDASTCDASIYSPYPLTGTASGTYWMAYFFIDDVMLRPLADAGQDQTISCNNTAVIGDNCAPIAGATYAWVASNAFTSSNSTISSPNANTSNVLFTAPGTFIYDLTVTYNGCTSTDQVIITVNSLGASTNITSVNLGCAGTQLAVTYPVTGAVYTWQPGSLPGTSVIVNPPSPTVYTLFASTSGCVNTGNITVNPFDNTQNCINEHVVGINITIPAGTSFVANTTYNNTNFTCLGTILVPVGATASFNNCTFMMAPGMVLNIKSKATVNITNSHFYGCKDLWKGILMPGQVGANLTITGSVIEDAFWGVRVAAAGSTGSMNFPNVLKVDNSIFNTNSTDIDYANTNTNTLSVKNSVFTSRCLNFEPSITPLPTISSSFFITQIATQPVSYLIGTTNQSPSFGIYMYEYLDTPGSGSQIDLKTFNVFDNHQIGIRTLNFPNLRIEKQFFVNGVVSKEMPFSSTGIYLTNSNFILTPISPSSYFFIGIGAGGGKGNRFENLNYGIYATAPKNSIIRTNVGYNSFKNINRAGIYYNSVPFNGSVPFMGSHIITANNFYNCPGYAISVINSGNTGMLITNNSVNNPTGTGIAYTGINISEISNPSTAKYNIAGNNLSNVNKGIVAGNVYGVNINNNNINLIQAPSTGPFFNFAQGVTMKNCKKPMIQRNNITGLTVGLGGSGAILDMGMSVSDCPQGTYSCNNMKDLLIGTNFNGQNLSTKVSQNTYDRNLVGVYLANNGFIDVQGNSTSSGASDNQFVNMPIGAYHSYAATVGSTITDGNLSPFFIRNVPAQFNMTNNGASASPPSLPVQVNYILSPLPYINSCVGSSGGSAHLMAGGFSPIADKVANPGLYAIPLVRENHTSKRQLYEQLVNTTAAPNGTLQAFKTANANGTLNDIAMVDSTISEHFDGDTTALQKAQNHNTFAATNSIESIQKDFNNLYLRYLKTKNLNSTEISQVKNIAQRCPFIDGTAVWQARALMRLMDDDAEYDNTCERIDPSNVVLITARKGNAQGAEIGTSQSVLVELVPNPNNGEFTLLLNMIMDELQVIVIDVNGKVVCESTQYNTDKLELSCTGLSNGVYLLKVFGNDNYLQTKKLLIQK